MLSTDWSLRQLYERLVGALEDRGIVPGAPVPTDRDWLALELDAGEGHMRPLATLLFRVRDSQQSCPQWVRQIKSRF